eukprot:972771_1
MNQRRRAQSQMKLNNQELDIWRCEHSQVFLRFPLFLVQEFLPDLFQSLHHTSPEFHRLPMMSFADEPTSMCSVTNDVNLSRVIFFALATFLWAPRSTNFCDWPTSPMMSVLVTLHVSRIFRNVPPR